MPGTQGCHPPSRRARSRDRQALRRASGRLGEGSATIRAWHAQGCCEAPTTQPRSRVDLHPSSEPSDGRGRLLVLAASDPRRVTLRAGRPGQSSSAARAHSAPRHQIGRLHDEAGPQKGSFIHTPLHVGKYLVSPLTTRSECGRIAAAVSIRSGRGSMTHDRVMRFVAVFATHHEAARFATEQGLAWIGRAPVLDPFPTTRDSR